MSDLRDAARQALEALDGLSEPYYVLKAQDALRAALEQPEQEPVVVMDAPLLLNGQPLYTNPPRREWRGLTDKEIQSIHDTYHKRMGPQEFARAIEAALKEKNK